MHQTIRGAGHLLTSTGKTPAELSGEAAASFVTLSVLGNGFILTALLWSSAAVFIIDARLLLAGAVFAVASAASLCGLIHSPLATGGVFWPWAMPAHVSAHFAGAYGVAAALCCLASLGARRSG